jgi:GT2 family glycosyltransferase
MEMPLVSIVISTWNRVDLLQEALESIKEQDYLEYEVIVVDNASDDGTDEYVKKFTEENTGHKVRYIKKDHSGYTAMQTLNEGFRNAIGKYILVLDDDAKFNQSNVISHLVSRMESNSNLALITPDILAPCGSPQMIEYRGDDYRTYAYCGACALMRASVFYSIGMYDEKLVLYWNEADVNVKLLYAGYDVIYDDSVSATHYFSEKQRVRKKMLYYHMRNGNMFLNRSLSFVNRLHIVPIRCINLLYWIHLQFDFDPVYLLRMLLLVVRSLKNIFVMKDRYHPCNSQIFDEVNEAVMAIHLEENKKLTVSYMIDRIREKRNKNGIR